MPKVGADTIAVVINVKVCHTMVIVGCAAPRELALLEDEKTVDAGIGLRLRS